MPTVNVAAAPSNRTTWAARLWANLAWQDKLVLLFHSYIAVRITLAADGHAAEIARLRSYALLAIAAIGLGAIRSELIASPRLRALAYRILIFFTMTASYFELRVLLPSLGPLIVDDQLHTIDRALFGTTPAVALAVFNARPVIEWFSFFYYSYFFILAAVIFPGLFAARGRAQAELLLGTVVVCAFGHIGYTLVPAYGPYAAIEFHQPIHGGFWWAMIEVLVVNAGTALDVFPSLHTAYPTFFVIHFFAHRHQVPHKYAWPVLAFFTANIIVATMLLRWHWGIDIVAGIALATTARLIAKHVAAIEATRAARGLQPVLEPLFGVPHESGTAR